MLSPGSSTRSTASTLGGELNTGKLSSLIALFLLSSRLPSVGVVDVTVEWTPAADALRCEASSTGSTVVKAALDRRLSICGVLFAITQIQLASLQVPCDGSGACCAPSVPPPTCALVIKLSERLAPPPRPPKRFCFMLRNSPFLTRASSTVKEPVNCANAQSSVSVALSSSLAC